MARLTKYTKAAIVRAVLADLPPAIDYRPLIQKRADQIALRQLPYAVAVIAKDPKLADYLQRQNVWVDGFAYFYVFGSREEGVAQELRVAINADAQIMDLVAERGALDTAETQLKRDIDLCATDAVFRERFPDLAKYLPTTVAETVRNLPATTATMDALKAAGWPKQAENA